MGISPRLLVLVASLQSRKLMSYRADFWINAVLGFAIQMGVIYFLTSAFFRGAPAGRIAGYTFDGMLVYYAVVTLFARIIRVNDLEGSKSREIYDGGLTRYMVYPTSYFFFKYSERLGDALPGLLQVLFFMLIVPFFIEVPPAMHPTAQSLAMTVVAIVLANFLHFVLYWPMEGVAFWADNVWSLIVMVHLSLSLLGGLMIPLAMFPDWGRAILDCTPFPYVFAFPVETFLGRVSPGEWARGLAVMAAWSVVLCLVTRLVWSRGERNYTGVGI